MNRFGNSFKPLLWLTALLLSALMVGCGGGGSGGSLPFGVGVAAGGTCAGASCVNLKSAGSLTILARSGVSTVPASAVTGDIGLSPAARVALTGFSETMDASNTFSTSAQVTGKLYAADYTPPTPSNLTTAVTDMIDAYNDAAGRPPGVGPNLNLLGGTVAGQTLSPGTYTWGSNVTIPTNLTFSGSPTDVWILQITGTLTQAGATNMILAGGAQAKNIFWQVAGVVSIGAGAHFEGILMSASAITFVTGSTANGRLYSGTAVNLQSTSLTRPAS